LDIPTKANLCQSTFLLKLLRVSLPSTPASTHQTPLISLLSISIPQMSTMSPYIPLFLLLLLALLRSNAFLASSRSCRYRKPPYSTNDSTNELISSRRDVIATNAYDETSSILARRQVINTIASTVLISTSLSKPTAFALDDYFKIYVSGTATLQSGISIDEIGTNASLYVTARPNKPDNVPRAILDGSRGKAPPVLSARFANPTFPFEFDLSSQWLTPEGASVVEGKDTDDVWWRGEDLIISARLDSDGVAATRDPTDLVGRGIYTAKDDSKVSIELQGRGMFGKAVTKK